ncbi:hypothetical protein B738_24547, partial [Photorhabdus temperata subsp. temperata M1021]
ANHSVVAWGDEKSGGLLPPEIAKLQDIVSLNSSVSSFSALRADRSVVAVGKSGFRRPSPIRNC